MCEFCYAVDMFTIVHKTSPTFKQINYAKQKNTEETTFHAGINSFTIHVVFLLKIVPEQGFFLHDF